MLCPQTTWFYIEYIIDCVIFVFKKKNRRDGFSHYIDGYFIFFFKNRYSFITYVENSRLYCKISYGDFSFTFEKSLKPSQCAISSWLNNSEFKFTVDIHRYDLRSPSYDLIKHTWQLFEQSLFLNTLWKYFKRENFKWNIHTHYINRVMSYRYRASDSRSVCEYSNRSTSFAELFVIIFFFTSRMSSRYRPVKIYNR